MSACWRGKLLGHCIRNQFLLYNRNVSNTLLIQERCIHSKVLSTNASRIEKSALTSSAYQGASIFEATRMNQFSTTTSNATNSNNGNASEFRPASESTLAEVSEKLRKDILEIFIRNVDGSYVHKDVVLENRLRNKTYVGILPYMKQSIYLRMWGHFRFAYLRPEILKITQHTEDSSIKIRWHVRAITGYQTLNIFRMRVWKPAEMIDQHGRTWIDGFSTFYVNEEGFIVKHIIDKVIPDQHKEPNIVKKIVDKIGGAPKLALFVQLSSDIVPHSI